MILYCSCTSLYAEYSPLVSDEENKAQRWGKVSTYDLPSCMIWFCCLVTKSCLTICNPMDCSMPAFPVLHYPSVCSNSCPLSQWCHPTISSSVAHFSPCPQSFPASGFFPVSQQFASGGQSIGASASVLPMSIQSWFPLGLTGLISLLSMRLSRVFSSTTIQKHPFFGTQPSLWSTSHIHT